LNQPTTPPGAGCGGPYGLSFRFHGRYDNHVGGGNYAAKKKKAMLAFV
jgi:hypothetical protein